jgi:heptosyltransferase-2
MHMAVAVDTPPISLFGPVDPKVGGYNVDNHISISKPVSCGPCEEGSCPKGTYLCMKKIEVEGVLCALKKLTNF